MQITGKKQFSSNLSNFAVEKLGKLVIDKG
jgi:hypothetical protein